MFLRLHRLFRMVGRDLVVLWFACRDARTPTPVKAAALLVALYVLSPIDLASDLLPIIGWADDITLLAFGVPALLKMLPVDVLQSSQTAAERLIAKWTLRKAG